MFKESEETEMKRDKEDLVKYLEKEISNFKPGEMIYDYLTFILKQLNQLDEPEVLSSDWINDNVEYAYYMTPRGTYSSAKAVIDPNKLENMLVPERELPVIPKFVADWIEEMKQDERPLYSVMSSLMNKTNHGWAVWKSANKNFSEIVAQAWLDGFTVEKEPLYRARLKVINDDFIASYLRTQSSASEDRLKALEIGSKYIHEDYRHLSEFTEDELKRLDIWDSEQWEVEEIEE